MTPKYYEQVVTIIGKLKMNAPIPAEISRAGS